MTWAACSSYCASYQYAGISAGSTCRCGNAFTFSQGLSLDASCQVPCTGSSSQSCGGSARSTIFFNSNFGNTSPAPSPSLATPPTSTASQLRSPIVVLPSISSHSLVFSSVTPVSQPSVATQAGPILPVTAALQLLGLSSAPSSAAVLIAPSAAVLPSPSSIRPIDDVSPPATLSAASALLFGVQPTITSSTPFLPPLIQGVIASSPTQGFVPPVVSSLGQSVAPALQGVPLSSIPPTSIPPLNGVLSFVPPAVASSTTTQVVSLSPSPLTQTISNTAIAFPLVLPAFSTAQVFAPVAPVLLQGPVSSPLLLPDAPTVSVPSQILPGLQSAVVLSQLVVVAALPTPTISSLLNTLPTPAGSVLQPQVNALPIAGGIPSPSPSVPNIPSVIGLPSTGLSSLLLVGPLAQALSNNFGVGPLSGGVTPVGTFIPTPLTSLGSSNEVATAVLGNVPPLVAAAPLLNSIPSVQTPSSLGLPILSPLAVPQLDETPLTPAPTLPSLTQPTLDVQSNGGGPADSVIEPETPWWVTTDFLEPHGLPPPAIFATPPPLALPPPLFEETTGLPAPLKTVSILGFAPTTSLVGAISMESTVAQVIDSGTVVDKFFTWTLYSNGNAQVDNTILSPVTGPIQAFLPDGTRVGMDSAGLYIGWAHRVPYPPEFLQIIQGYLLPPPELFL